MWVDDESEGWKLYAIERIAGAVYYLKLLQRPRRPHNRET
jgi:hypothetical protein